MPANTRARRSGADRPGLSAAGAPAPAVDRRPLEGGQLALLLLSVALVLPITSAYLVDLAGWPLRSLPLAAAAAVQLAVAALLLRRARPRGVALRPTRLLGVLLSFGATLALGLSFAWPTMLPVSTSVDEVNHFLLADYLMRHLRLPAGDEAASLVEMAQYPFGPHLLAALGARLLDRPAFVLLHAVAALSLAAMAAFAYGVVAEEVDDRRGGDLAALVAPLVLLWPTGYALGQFTSDFFLGQMFGIACLLGALYWARAASPLALPALVLVGAGLVFSYPTLLPIFGLGVAVARRRLAELAVVGLPLALLAAAYLVARAGTGLAVVRQGGVALAPTPETLPPAFLTVALAGLAWASWRRRRRPLAGFAWAALLQTALVLAADRLAGELSRYAVDKMVYVLAPLLAVLAATLLAEALVGPRPTGRPTAAPTRLLSRLSPLLAGLAVATAVTQVAPRLTRPVGDRVPHATLSAELVAAAGWLRERAPDQAPLYLSHDHLSAYWVEIGLLGRERTATALPRFHDRVRSPGHYWEWSTSPGAPPFALATADLLPPLGPEAEEHFRAGEVRVVQRREGADRPRPLGWVGRDLAVLDARLAERVAAPGDNLRVAVELGTVETPREDYALVARLRDWRGELRGEARPVVVERGLRPGRRLVAELSLPLDRSLPRGAYRLELLPFRLPSWDLAPARSGPRPEAPEIVLSGGPLLVAPTGARPPPDLPLVRPIGARFGDQVELVGLARLEPRDRSLEVELVWRALRPVEHDYSVFLHMVDGDGRLLDQADGFAWDGAYPTSAWVPGQALVDRRTIGRPAAGPWALRVGLYRLDGGQRLPVGGGDFVVAAAAP